MTNFLDMRCPKCNGDDQLDIQARIWIRVCNDGTDADLSCDGNQYYEPDSPAQCAACGHYDTVRQFEIAGSVP